MDGVLSENSARGVTGSRGAPGPWNERMIFFFSHAVRAMTADGPSTSHTTSHTTVLISEP